MKYYCYFLLFLYSLVGFSQQEKDYLKDYFLFPIKPNQQNFLAGTMGEIRSNHFHAGIDIKTDQRTGLAVYAAADGFISRISVSAYGYGNALYIEHPTGHTTVYAHLDNFDKRMDSVVLALQYQQKSFSIDQYFPKNMFPVKRGDIVASSGNTGGSQGPHLHFEIRDEHQHILNPLDFDFEEIKDQTPPIIRQIGLTSYDERSHVKNQFGTFFFSAVKTGTAFFKVSEIVPVYGKVGISLKADDLLDGASNQNGINLIIVKIDSQEIFRFHNTRISYAKKLHMNQHIDYHSLKQGKGFFHKCYLDEGNHLDGYSIDRNKGYLMIEDSLLHDIEIQVYDGYNNKSTLVFKVQGQKLQNTQKAIAGTYENVSHEVLKNVLKITVQHKTTVTNPTLFVNGNATVLTPTYNMSGKSIYLWNLTQGLPDSLKMPTKTYPFHFLTMIPSPNSFNFYHKDFNLSFDKHTLFDTLYLEMERTGNEFDFRNTHVPFADYFTLELKPTMPIANQEKAGVYEKRGAGLSYIGGTWKHDQIKFSTRNFGEYVISTDMNPPTIAFLGKKGSEVSFKIGDDKSGIESINAYINGEWLLMKYDYKNRMIISERLDKSKPLHGDLRVEVVDKANNKKIYTLKL